jgi:hypothetical protein
LIRKDYENEVGYKEGLEITYKVAEHSTSPEKYIKWFEGMVSPFKISPFFELYFELQANCVYYKLLKNDRKKIKVKARIEDLIRKTGFTYFSKFIV